MNYYERHIGDFIKDTLGLSMLEDGAYNRLLDQVYQTERPLPCDKKEIYRNARANTAPERKAVDYVLGKFFDLGPDGYMQKRAQAVLEEYWDREPAEQNKRENAKVRQQRSRERRRQLFDDLRSRGVTPAFNASMKALEAELSRVTSSDNSTTSNAPVTRDDTATQYPTPNPQTPTTTGNSASTQPEQGAPEGFVPAPAALLSKAMRPFGINSDPGDLRLQALASQGIAPETVAAACREAKAAKPNEAIRSGYVFAILERWAKDAAQMRVAGAEQPRVPGATAPASLAEQNARNNAEAKRLLGIANEDDERRTIDAP